MRKNKGWVAYAVFAALLVVPMKGQFTVTDIPLTATTVMMRAQQLLQYIKEAQTALMSIQMAQQMVREGINLAQHPSMNILSDLSMLSSILVQSQGLAGNMAQMSAQFQNTYAPYTPSSMVNYASAYNGWASTALKSINGSLNVAGYQGSILQKEAAWMQQVQTMNQTPMGQDSLLQLGNTIGTQEIAQLQSLRQLMIANMQANAAVTAQTVTTQQSSQSTQSNAFADAHWISDGILF